jgi:hypothetical protein
VFIVSNDAFPVGKLMVGDELRLRHNQTILEGNDWTAVGHVIKIPDSL